MMTRMQYILIEVVMWFILKGGDPLFHCFIFHSSERWPTIYSYTSSFSQLGKWCFKKFMQLWHMITDAVNDLSPVKNVFFIDGGIWDSGIIESGKFGNEENWKIWSENWRPSYRYWPNLRESPNNFVEFLDFWVQWGGSHILIWQHVLQRKRGRFWDTHRPGIFGLKATFLKI